MRSCQPSKFTEPVLSSPKAITSVATVPWKPLPTPVTTQAYSCPRERFPHRLTTPGEKSGLNDAIGESDDNPRIGQWLFQPAATGECEPHILNCRPGQHQQEAVERRGRQAYPAVGERLVNGRGDRQPRRGRGFGRQRTAASGR